MRITGCSIAAIVAGIAFGGWAFAGVEPQAAPSVSITYSASEVSTPAQVRQLLTRIEQAADEVCGPSPDIRELSRHMAYKACIANAVEGAVKSINRPLVADIYGKPWLTPDANLIDGPTGAIPSSANVPPPGKPGQVASEPKPKSVGDRLSHWLNNLFN